MLILQCIGTKDYFIVQLSIPTEMDMMMAGMVQRTSKGEHSRHQTTVSTIDKIK